jgi:hypothetical protein
MCYIVRTLTYIPDTIAFDRGEYFEDQLGWGSSQARDGLPKGKCKSGILKFLQLASPCSYHQVGGNYRSDPHIERGCFGWENFQVTRAGEPEKGMRITGESLDSKGVDILWICRIFSQLISL